MSDRSRSYVAAVVPLVVLEDGSVEFAPYLTRIERSESLRRLQDLVRSPADGGRSLIDAVTVTAPHPTWEGAACYVHDEGLFLYPLNPFSFVLAGLGYLAQSVAGPMILVGNGGIWPTHYDGEDYDVPAWLADLLDLGDELSRMQRETDR